MTKDLSSNTTDKTGTELKARALTTSVLELMGLFGLYLKKLHQEDIRFTDHQMEEKHGIQLMQ
jgi:hypothetical protein